MSIYAYQLLKSLGISESRVRRVLPSIKVESLEPDHTICHKGARPEVWTHVLSGLVSAGIPDKDGVVTPINIFGPGTWFGEVAILNSQSLLLECICLTPVRILTMPLGQAVEAFEHEAEFARHIARLVSWRAQQQAEMLTLMRQGSPQLRVVMGLALFAEALHNGSSHFPTNDLAPPTTSTTSRKSRSSSPCWRPCAASRAAYFPSAFSNSQPQAGSA